MYCPRCGARNPDDARYCMSCRAELPGAGVGAGKGRLRPAAPTRGRASGGKLLGVLVLGLVLVVAAAAWLGLSGELAALGTGGSTSGPSSSTSQPAATPTLPPGSGIFADPRQPAYVPGKGFAPDAKRILDLTILQISLEHFHASNGAYPQSLALLFPAFAPKANGVVLSGPPVDPVSGKPYDYRPSADGQDYQLSAELDSGKAYSVTKAGPQ